MLKIYERIGAERRIRKLLNRGTTGCRRTAAQRRPAWSHPISQVWACQAMISRSQVSIAKATCQWIRTQYQHPDISRC